MDSLVKERLLKLVDEAVHAGWAHTRACDLLGVADVRAHRWRARLREHGTLVDRAPGGNPVHRLLAWEEAEILDLIERWAPVDRSHASSPTAAPTPGGCSSRRPRCAAWRRNTRSACRASRRGPRSRHALPEIPWERNRIWIWDASHFTRAKWVAYAIVDVVTRY